MTLYPPSSMFPVVQLEVCWESDHRILVNDEADPRQNLGRRCSFH